MLNKILKTIKKVKLFIKQTLKTKLFQRYKKSGKLGD